MTPLEETIIQYFEDPPADKILSIFLRNRDYNLTGSEIQAKLDDMLRRRLLVTDNGQYYAVRR